MAAIEKDISRDGQGYREVRDWLFRVLALRLRRLVVPDGSAVSSTGTERQSLTILPSTFSSTNITHSGTETKGSNIFASETGALLSLTNSKLVTSSFQAATIWHASNRRNASQSTMEANPFMMMGPSSNTNRSVDLDHFRRFLFESMRHIVEQIHKTGSWNVKSFWSTLSSHLSQVQNMLEDERQMILLFYYRA
jgi:hypothetical protein